MLASVSANHRSWPTRQMPRASVAIDCSSPARRDAASFMPPNAEITARNASVVALHLLVHSVMCRVYCSAVPLLRMLA